MAIPKITKISLNEIASYSDWPSRLLSIEPFAVKNKNKFEINREFGDEKWGVLLNSFKNDPDLSLSDIEAMEQDLDEIIPCYHKTNGFYLTQAKNAHIQQLEIYEKILSQYAPKANGLVELGAGYGSKIIRLSNMASLNQLPLYAADLTESGSELIGLLASREKKEIQVGRCDFNTLDVKGLEIPDNSIIFTSYSVHYVPSLKENFVDFLSQFKPKVVVHFEPCYEFFDSKSLHGLMCKRYMNLNGYTQNIASALSSSCEKISAEFKAQQNVFGTNPFLPISIVEWIPNK